MTRPAESSDEEPVRLDRRKLAAIRPREYLIRFIFGAAVSSVAAVATVVAGPRFGGMFLAFPAILPATLTLLEKKEGLPQAVSDLRGATLGAIGMIGFATIGGSTMLPAAGLRLLAALAGWALLSAGLYGALRLLAATVGERQYLPEIPAVEAAPAVEALAQRGLTLALVESCTGGSIAALLTSVPGAGSVVRGGFVVWADNSKEAALGIDPALTAEHGVVSPVVTRELALAGKRALGADIGLAITGVEGDPKSGRPSGVTYLALTTADDRTLLRSYRHDHGAGRNRERDIRMALALLQRSMDGEPEVMPALGRRPAVDAAAAR